jgi:hypothetical protein
MSEPAYIRRYEPGEEAALFDIYFTAIHLVASHDYTVEQVQAWAPRDLDAVLWKNKMREINPFVAEFKGNSSAMPMCSQTAISITSLFPVSIPDAALAHFL